MENWACFVSNSTVFLYKGFKKMKAWRPNLNVKQKSKNQRELNEKEFEKWKASSTNCTSKNVSKQKNLNIL